VLVRALGALGQRPARDLAASSLESIWEWALDNWQLGAMAGQKSIPADQYTMDKDKNRLS
jgi:hypothetical protein